MQGAGSVETLNLAVKSTTTFKSKPAGEGNTAAIENSPSKKTVTFTTEDKNDVIVYNTMSIDDKSSAGQSMPSLSKTLTKSRHKGDSVDKVSESTDKHLLNKQTTLLANAAELHQN